MKIKELLKKYVFNGGALNFDSLYTLAKSRKIYTNKNDFEIDLERAMDEGLVGCKVVQNENRFYSI